MTSSSADTNWPSNQVEYKLRRMVNDYLQPPKVTRKMEIGLERFEAIRDDLEQLHAREPHELMRAMEEVHFIRDCAEMAARVAVPRGEPGGACTTRFDFPERNDAEWFCHAQIMKGDNGEMTSFKRPIEPYIAPISLVRIRHFATPRRCRSRHPCSAAGGSRISPMDTQRGRALTRRVSRACR